MNNGPNVNISTVIQAVGGGDSGAVMTGDLIMASGYDIRGDFSSSPTTRTIIQSSTLNGASNVNIAPNGTSTDASINTENSSGLNNGYRSTLFVSAIEAGISTGVRGTGTALPFNIYNNGKQCIKLDTLGNIVAGPSVTLATTATDGFLYIPKCAGTPTGVPTAKTGALPLVIDSTNNKMYFYSGSAWVALN